MTILIFSLIASAITFYYEWKYPFSNGKYVAEYIDKNFDKDEVMIVGYADFTAETVSGYLNKDIYYPNSKNVKKLVDWHDRTENVTIDEIFSEADYFADKYGQVILVNMFEVQEAEIPFNYNLLEKFTDSIVNTENYYLYYFNKTEILNKSKLIQKFDYSNFSDFWIPVNQCYFSIKNNNIYVKATGTDPYFESIFPIIFDKKDTLMMIVRINSPINSRFQIFYKRYGQNYNEDDSQYFTLFSGMNNIYINIPNPDDLENIRIDPVCTQADTIIKSVEFYKLDNAK